MARVDGKVTKNSSQYKYYFEWSSTQDTDKNQSTITVSHYWEKTGTTLFDSVGKRDYGISIDGTEDTGSKVMDYSPWHNNAISTFSHTVDHNPDGSKSVVISTWANGTAGSYGPSSSTADANDCTASATITLPTIPRKATLSAAPNFTDEENPTITYSNPAGNSVTTLQAAIYDTAGSASYAGYRDITKTGTSYTFNLTNDERTKLRKAATGNTLKVRFYIRTVIGGTTHLHYLEKTLTIVNNKPVLNVSVKDSNETTKALTGNADKLVKYYSNATATATYSAVKEASIKSYQVVHNNITRTANPTTFNAVENGSFSFSVTDSRNNTTTIPVTKQMVDYIKLTCNLDASNPTADGEMNLKISGSYFNGSFGAQSNTLALAYRIKENDGAYGAWITAAPTISGNSYSFSVKLTGLNYRTTYTFEAQATDKLATVPSAAQKVKTLPVFDWGENDFAFNVPVIFNAGFTQSVATAAEGMEFTGDYVIEQGNNGSYAYRKWNSGLMEAWRSATSSVSVTSSSTSGALYFTDQVTLKTNGAAAQFVSLESVQVTVNKNGAVGLWQPIVARTAVDSGAASANVFFMNTVKDASVSIVPYIHFTGRWK